MYLIYLKDMIDKNIITTQIEPTTVFKEVFLLSLILFNKST